MQVDMQIDNVSGIFSIASYGRPQSDGEYQSILEVTVNTSDELF